MIEFDVDDLLEEIGVGDFTPDAHRELGEIIQNLGEHMPVEDAASTIEAVIGIVLEEYGE